jgi:hypothetical protein
MRFTAFIACLLVAADCAQSANGGQPQAIFGPEAVWLWWPVAVAWGASGFLILLRGAP